MGFICLYVLIQKSGQKPAKSHLCAITRSEASQKKGNFYLVIYFSRFYLLSRLLVGNNPRQLWPPRTYKGDPFCNILSRIDSLNYQTIQQFRYSRFYISPRTSLEMDETLDFYWYSLGDQGVNLGVIIHTKCVPRVLSKPLSP